MASETPERRRDDRPGWKDVLQALPLLVWTGEPGGELDYFSPQFQAYTGLGEDRLLGAGWVEIVHPEDRQPVLERWSETVSRSVPFDADFRMRRGDGAYRWFKVRAVPLRDREGRIAKWLGTCTDIEDQKRAQEVLRGAQDQLRGVLDTLFTFVGVLTPDGTLIEVNRPALEVAGLVPGQVLGRRFQDTYWWAYDPAVQERIRDTVERAARGEASRYDVAARIGPDRFLTIDFAMAPMRGPDGTITHLIPSAIDITERVRIEQELRESESRFRAVTEWLPQIVWTALPDGTVDYHNRRWSEYSVRPVGDWKPALHPDDVAPTANAWEEAMRTGSPYEVSHRVRRHDGVYRWHLSRALPLRDAGGRIVKWFGTATDIEDQKRTERRLRESNAELEQFAYVASHDLQEPLRNVASYADLLGKRYRGRLDPDADEFIGYVVDGVKRMQHLIQDLLAYSRVGRQDRRAPVPMDEAIDQALANLERALREAEAVVTRDPMPVVPGVRPQLVQLWQNLVGNALKFRGAAPSRIHLGAERQGEGWAFSVRDNGIGIEPRHLDRIFGLFQRLHPREAYSGTGVGLAICRKIVEAHGGTIAAASRPGEGTTFTFTLPDAPEEGGGGVRLHI